MKKNTLFTIISLMALTIASCKKIPSLPEDESTKEPDKTVPASAYYVTYKVDGIPVSATEVSALRGITVTPRTLTILGNAKNAGSPKFKFYLEESYIGFVRGLSVLSSENSAGSHYIEYTNSANVLFSTEIDKEGTSLFISEASFTNGGIIKGTFNGRVKTDKGVTVQITEGAFSAKFSN